MTHRLWNIQLKINNYHQLKQPISDDELRELRHGLLNFEKYFRARGENLLATFFVNEIISVENILFARNTSFN